MPRMWALCASRIWKSTPRKWPWLDARSSPARARRGRADGPPDLMLPASCFGETLPIRSDEQQYSARPILRVWPHAPSPASPPSASSPRPWQPFWRAPNAPRASWFQAAFAADLAALRPYLAHDLAEKRFGFAVHDRVAICWRLYGDHIWSVQIEHQCTQITRVWAWVRFYVRMINSAGVITLSGREDIKLA